MSFGLSQERFRPSDHFELNIDWKTLEAALRHLESTLNRDFATPTTRIRSPSGAIVPASGPTRTDAGVSLAELVSELETVLVPMVLVSLSGSSAMFEPPAKRS